jgi:flagellar basal-body rod protein FlgF
VEEKRVDSGFYAACSGMLARMQALDVTANNLANVDTAGYKSQMEFYSAITASLTPAPLSSLNQAINRYGILGGDSINEMQGSLTPTGNPLDLAIEGPGFFMVQTKAGIRFTRDGNFHLNENRQLVTPQDDPVLGLGGPITIPAFGKVGPVSVPPGTVSISEDGTVSVGGAMAGRLSIAEFTPGTSLTPEGALYFDAPDGSAHLAANSAIHEGVLESSNMNAVSGTIDLIAIQRSADLMLRAVSIFNNDFNKTAAEEVGRV